MDALDYPVATFDQLAVDGVHFEMGVVIEEDAVEGRVCNIGCLNRETVLERSEEPDEGFLRAVREVGERSLYFVDGDVASKGDGKKAIVLGDMCDRVHKGKSMYFGDDNSVGLIFELKDMKEARVASDEY